MTQREKPINIGDMITPEGFKAIAVGQTLGFQKDGKLTRYKVVRRHVKRKELWVRPITLYKPEDVQVKDKEV